MTTWFISDLHVGHRNIIRFESEFRPYSSIQAHDEDLARAWNDVVRPNDVVWVLGDFAWNKKSLEWLKHRHLMGHKKLVMGNHDTLQTQAYLDYGFDKLYGMAQWDRRCVMTHAPLMLPDKGRFAVNLHGHSHSKPGPTDRHINVAVEQCVKRTGSPRPLAWEELEPEIRKLYEMYPGSANEEYSR